MLLGRELCAFRGVAVPSVPWVQSPPRAPHWLVHRTHTHTPCRNTFLHVSVILLGTDDWGVDRGASGLGAKLFTPHLFIARDRVFISVTSSP